MHPIFGKLRHSMGTGRGRVFALIKEEYYPKQGFV